MVINSYFGPNSYQLSIAAGRLAGKISHNLVVPSKEYRMDDYIGRGYDQNRRKPSTSSSHKKDQIRMVEYKEDVTQVQPVSGMEIGDDEELEPHVSLSTIMAVFVSPHDLAERLELEKRKKRKI